MRRILGSEDSITRGHSQRRTRGLAMWGWLLILFGAAGGLSVIGLISTLANPEPLTVKIEDLVQSEPSRSWVRVSGFPIYSMTIEQSEDDRVTAWYYHLRDTTTGSYLLVRSSTDPSLRPAEPVTIEGMLRSTPGDMRDVVLENVAQGYRTCSTHYLVPDQKPVPLWICVTGILVSVVVCAIILLGRMNRGTTTFRQFPQDA